MTYLTIVVEDLVSESVINAMVGQLRPDWGVHNCIGKRGDGYIRAKLRGLNQAAEGMKIFALADRDTLARCPVELRREWVAGPQHPNLVFRIAEMEVESWVLADADAVGEYLSIGAHRIPHDVDSIADPKQFLVNLARNSRFSQIREGIAPTAGSTAAVGPMYNLLLCDLVAQHWSLDRGRARSRSLNRAAVRMLELFDR
tara:strand:- start:155 stop:754 length:600 start_codon:yes stop_codon:yes gene_type:complete